MAQRRTGGSIEEELPWFKVQAHVQVPTHPETEEDLRIVLNDKADDRAKHANSWHDIGSTEEDLRKQQASRGFGLLRDAGELLARS